MHGSEQHFGSTSKLHLGNISLILEIRLVVRVHQMLNCECRRSSPLLCIRSAGLHWRDLHISHREALALRRNEDFFLGYYLAPLTNPLCKHLSIFFLNLLLNMLSILFLNLL
jgi:hypothetical protein